MKAHKPAENSAKTAIAYTERVTGLRVTVHDLTHNLWQMLPAERFRHAHPACHAVKTGVHGAKCMAFEIDDLRPRAHAFADGRVHVCHAGFSEAAYPVFHAGRLALVLFLGPFVPPEARSARAARGSRGQRAAAADHRILPRRSRDEAALALEALRQLGARLRCIIIDLNAEVTRQDVSRETSIRSFILANYHTPLTLADLAGELGVSSERARHVVAEACGCSFRELLELTRVEAATALLLNTRLTVEEIAVRAGFAGRATLTRVFGKRHGCSPRAWRRNHQS